MCDPVTITVIAASVYQANNQLEEGKYAAKVGKYEKGVADYNAQVDRNAAEGVRKEGVEEENVHRRKVNELISRQRAQSAASGVDVSFGSSAALQEDSQVMGEADALRIRGNFEDKASALNIKADLTEAQGNAAKKHGKNLKRAGRNQAIGTLLQGAATAGSLNPSWFKADSAATLVPGGDFSGMGAHGGYSGVNQGAGSGIKFPNTSGTFTF